MLEDEIDNGKPKLFARVIKEFPSDLRGSQNANFMKAARYLCPLLICIWTSANIPYLQMVRDTRFDFSNRGEQRFYISQSKVAWTREETAIQGCGRTWPEAGSLG
jgi:hypothetical protein